MNESVNPNEARRALEETQRRSDATDEVVAAVSGPIRELRERREENHFAAAFRRILRGA